jgi:uncharacterized protein (DUF433 family)
MSDLRRITVDRDICHGKPCVRHMRWPVEVVLDMVASGMSMDEILADHAELEREDILACREYARLLTPASPLATWPDARSLRCAYPGSKHIGPPSPKSRTRSGATLNCPAAV